MCITGRGGGFGGGGGGSDEKTEVKDTIFVMGLSEMATEDLIAEYFAGAGEIKVKV